MHNRHERDDSERLRSFCDRLTDGRTDICDCRVAFATENFLVYSTSTKRYMLEMVTCITLIYLSAKRRSGSIYNSVDDWGLKFLAILCFKTYLGF